MIGECEICERKNVPCSSCEESQRTICFLCQGDIADPYCEIDGALMQVDRGFSLETIVMCSVDLSSGIAGQIDCIECGGDGNWGKFAPEIVGADCPCVECKGTGRVYVSI